MKSKSFIQFARMQQKNGNLMELSKYKKELPEEYECYRTAYDKAWDEVQKCHNRGVAGYTNFDYMNPANILKQVAFDKTIPYPDLPYEEAKAKAAEVEARNRRIAAGTPTHEDYLAVTREMYGKKG